MNFASNESYQNGNKSIESDVRMDVWKRKVKQKRKRNDIKIYSYGYENGSRGRW